MNSNGSHIEAHILLSYLLGRLGGEDLARVEQWLNESEANRRELDRLEFVWLESGKLSPEPVPVDVDKAWEKMKDLMVTADVALPETPAPGKIIRMTPLRWLSAAAAVVLLAVGTWWGLRTFSSAPEMLMVKGSDTVKQDTLPDGTLISLNSGSTLEYPEKFGGKNREVRLKGDAYFKVSPDKSQPFVIDAGRAFIKVLGTSFLVKADSGAPLVVVVREGLVMLFTVSRISGDTASLMLTSGQSGILGPSGPGLLAKPGPDESYWLDHRLEFRDTPLSEVIALISKYTGAVVRVSNPAILDCHLTSTFENEPAETMLKVISESFGLELKKQGNEYLLSGNGCSL